ncbi:MAG: hypothetical protein IKV61_03860 [Clostridia bacterium]|nr:hypothetical protein [Clostridia bacterium]
MFKSIKELLKMKITNLKCRLFGIKPKKAIPMFKQVLPGFNLAKAPRSYRKSGIDRRVSGENWYATYTVTHLFATAYKNTFSAEATFSRDRYYYKTKIFGKEREALGPYVYNTTAKVVFENLPMKDYVKTQTHLKQTYPQVRFNFYKNCVDVYISRTVKNLKQAKAVLYDFKRIYDKIGSSLVSDLNYIHYELHK